MEKTVFGKTYPDMVLTATFAGFTKSLPWTPTESNKQFAREGIRRNLEQIKDVSDFAAQVNMAVAEAYLAAFGY